MARNTYRDGLAQVNVVLDPELRDRMRRRAARNGRSMSEEFRLAALEWLGEGVEDGVRGVGPGSGRFAAADVGGSRPPDGGDRLHTAVVGVGDVADLTADPFFDDVEFLPAVGDTRSLRAVPDAPF
jgi:hypothetical protein